MMNSLFLYKKACAGPLALVAVLGWSLVSCNNYLEVTPQDQVSGDVAWSNPETADLFLNDIYSSLPNYQVSYRCEDQWTDDAMNNQNWQWIQERVRSGDYSPTSWLQPDEPWYSSGEQWDWGSNYRYIRKCNVFIKHVMASESLPDDYKKQRVGEARFLRAWFYMYLFNYFGGVPIITEPLDIETEGDNIFRERATAEETAAFIARECEEAAADLPDREEEAGRISKGAALALKGFAELVVASPLNNPENDPAKWAKAASTYRQVMGMGYQLMPYYNGLWLEENNGNAEVMFYRTAYFPRQDFNPESRYREDTWGPAWVEIDGKLVNYSIATGVPVQDLIDAYRMEDGKTIEESPLYDPAHPYERREPRFYESIIYDGATWRNTVITTRVGGNNAVDKTRNEWRTCTGYYFAKTLDERLTGLLARPNGKKSLANWSFIRYAEVLLGFAEAENEASGPTAEALNAINQVRKRGGIPTVQESYGAVSKEKLREIIRNERRIELVLEGKRYYDLLRWKIAETKLNGWIKGVEITAQNGSLHYDYFNVAPQFFHPEKNYRFPIPQAVVEQNPKLEQNPNY